MNDYRASKLLRIKEGTVVILATFFGVCVYSWLIQSTRRARHKGIVVLLTLLFFHLVIPFASFAQAANIANMLSPIEKRDSQPAPSEAKTTKSPNEKFLEPTPKYQSCGDIFKDYIKELEELAKKCDELDMTLEASVTRSLIYSEQPYYFTVPLLPNEQTLSALPDDATKNQRAWFSKLRRIRKQYADETYSLAERYGKKKRGYDVVSCILTTLFIEPDHAKARGFLGYSLKDGKWRTKWQLSQLEKGRVETEEFGWLPAEYVDRYRKGERFYNKQWISAEEEKEKILASSSGWRVETEHFSILSRVSLERGVEIGRFLETYYQTWSRLFYRFIATDVQWSLRLRSESETVSKRYRVILYRNREEYLRELRKHDSNVFQSEGGYFPNLKCIFVYEPGKDDDFDLYSLLAHEATHQLFEECNVTSAGRKKTDFTTRAQYANFWEIEGIAVYAETYRLNESKTLSTLGGYKGVFRIQCALESLNDGGYIKLREYAKLSRKEFQSRSDLSALYSQAAGLTFFFMHYKDGIYRDPFIVYLFCVYQGIDAPNSLEQITGKSFEELDQEYADFMKSLSDEI